MQLNRLTLTQVRAFEQVEFNFQPGMNLLVGVNGIGKSTVLDAIRILLSKALPEISAARKEPLDFNDGDITFGQDWLRAEIRFTVSDTQFEYEARRWDEEDISLSPQEGNLQNQIEDRSNVNRLTIIDKSTGLPQPLSKTLQKHLKASAAQPLALYFSTQRSFPNLDEPSKRAKAGGKAAAFIDALNRRDLRLLEFAEWWLVQKDLAEESASAQRNLDILESAVMHFLDACVHLHAKRQVTEDEHEDRAGVRSTKRETQTSLLLNKAGATLNVNQFSDGERGLLAIVLDLTRRLSQANPGLENPLRDGQAVVLLDELDLHLHPIWQRTIVEKLARTFPKCQFIATTHSPQIVGEVSPESIIILENNHSPYRPQQSLGMDSNWVLQFLMGTVDRNGQVSRELDRISELIENEEYDQAEAEINQLRAQIGDFPDLVKLQTRLDRLQLLGM